MNVFTMFGGLSMRKLFTILSVLAVVCLFSACGAPAAEPTAPSTSMPETTLPETAPPTTLPPETEAPTEPEGFMHFNTYDITFSAPGESWELYDGTLPPEAVTFLSDSEAVATFENGIVTAVGNGITEVHAVCQDATITCVIRNVFDIATLSRDPVLVPPEVTEEETGFFDDAVFIGDSVTLMLQNYQLTTSGLGKPQFLVQGSYSVFHAVNNTMLVSYRGGSMRLPEAVAATGAKKAFIMLGANDIGAYGIEKTIENWQTMLTRIREKAPDIEIYIQSMTPVWTGGEQGNLNNANADEYNKALKAFAGENGCIFVDIAPYMKDATGGLATEYCSDKYIHLTFSGARVWVQVLNHFAENRK